MNLRQCLDNLKYDINNGGLMDDSFAMNCYVTMANEARRILGDCESEQKLMSDAMEYLSACCKSGNVVLKCIAEGR